MAKYNLSDIFIGDYRISQRYGANPLYYKRFGLWGHEGVDWATPVGVRVINPFNRGQILRAAWDSAYGWHVVIWDPVQLCAVWYCHLSRIDVRVGQTIGRAVQVGLTGNTGNSSGPHLHVNFVETDRAANRLNRYNGYQGFLNILDPKLVSWTITR
jgi:murein DD-endopeptidase MepM/ murein hydrolase activator NlpD